MGTKATTYPDLTQHNGLVPAPNTRRYITLIGLEEFNILSEQTLVGRQKVGIARKVQSNGRSQCQTQGHFCRHVIGVTRAGKTPVVVVVVAVFGVSLVLVGGKADTKAADTAVVSVNRCCGGIRHLTIPL